MDSCAWWIHTNSGDHVEHGAPFAVYRFANGNAAKLCQAALNIWLDNADDDPSLEPAELVFL